MGGQKIVVCMDARFIIYKAILSTGRKCKMSIKGRIIEMMREQRWSFRVVENYNTCHTKYRTRKKIIFYVSVPIAVITYPFRSRSMKSLLSKDCVYNVRGGVSKGLKIFAPECDTDIMQKYYLMMDNIHDFDFLGDFTKRFLKKDMVIFDIGGNIGNHTMYWAMHSEAKCIWTFEPNPHTFEILSKNIEINHLTDRVKLLNCGCGEKSGSFKMEITSSNSGANKILENSEGECRVVTLDSLEAEVSKVDFIKIDVEGMEYSVIMGAKHILKKFHPMILLEIFEENFKRVDALLRSLGYENVDYELLSYRCDYLYKYIGNV